MQQNEQVAGQIASKRCVGWLSHEQCSHHYVLCSKNSLLLICEVELHAFMLHGYSNHSGVP
jgi:hypothetical protein